MAGRRKPKTRKSKRSAPTWSAKPSSRRFSGLDGERFEHLMFALLGAECRLRGLDVADFHFDLAANKGDGGVDAIVRRAPASPSRWISGPTIIQAKLSCPSRSKLVEELAKTKVVAALAQNHDYLLVTAASMTAGSDELLTNLIRTNRPGWTGSARVIGEGQLLALLREYPSVWSMMPEELRPHQQVLSFDGWKRHLEHRDKRPLVPFVSTPERDEVRQRVRNLFESKDRYLHIEGAPGVGKTRCAFEAFNESPQVVGYCPRFTETLLTLPREAGRALLGSLVVDECNEEERLRLEDHFKDSGTAIVTIGTDVPWTRVRPRAHTVRLEVLQGDDLRAVAGTLGEGFSETDRIVTMQRSGGYPKLLRLLFDARDSFPTDPDIDSALVRYLSREDQREAEFLVVALPRAFSTSDLDRLAGVYPGLTTAELHGAVRRLEDTGLLGDLDERTHYVTPLLLGEMLARRFWKDPVDAFARLERSGLGHQLLESCLERLVRMQGGPELLARVGPEAVERAMGPTGLARFLAAIAAYVPEQALAALRRFLPGLAKPNTALQALLTTAWFDATFLESAELLSTFAAGRDELPTLFGAVLGMTRAPGQRRLALIERWTGSDEESLRLLAVECAFAACEGDGARFVWRPPEDVETAWRPATYEEEATYREKAAELLARGLSDLLPSVRGLASQRGLHAIRGLIRARFAGVAARLIELWGASELPTAPLISVFNTIETHDREYLGASGAAAQERFSQAVRSLRPRSIGDRLSIVARPASWGEPDLTAIEEVAAEAMAMNDVTAVADWCFSEDASVAIEVGRALSRHDSKGRLFPLLVERSRGGTRHRAAAAYFGERPDIDDALERWTSDRSLASLALETAWLLEPTERHIAIVVNLVERRFLEPRQVEILLFGGWLLRAPVDGAQRCIRAIAATEPGAAFRLAFQVFEKTDPAFVAECWWRVPMSTLGRGQLTWEWGRTARAVASGRPLEVGLHLIEALRRDDDLPSEVGQTLNRILRDAPGALVRQTLDLLEQRPELAVGLDLSGLATKSSQIEELLGWATTAERARLVVRARGIVDDVAIDLMERFPIEETVSAVLHSGVWSGPESVRLEALRAKLEQALQSRRSRRFERWAHGEIRALDRALVRARRVERALEAGVIDLPFVAEGPRDDSA